MTDNTGSVYRRRHKSMPASAVIGGEIPENGVHWRRPSQAVIMSQLPSAQAHTSDTGIILGRHLANMPSRKSDLLRRRKSAVHPSLLVGYETEEQLIRRRMSIARSMSVTEGIDNDLEQWQRRQSIKSMTASMSVKRKYRMDVSFEVSGMDESFIESSETIRTQGFECDICKYQTKYKQNLTRHMKIHRRHSATPEQDSSRKTFLCDKCTKTFKTKFGMQLHVRTKHEHIFKYTCAICDKGFNTSWNYRGHLGSHHSVCALKCQFCNLKFQNKTTLAKHTNNAHKSKEFKCQNCENTFSSMDALREHNYALHKNRLLSCTCGKRYKWRSSLFYHKKNCEI